MLHKFRMALSQPTADLFSQGVGEFQKFPYLGLGGSSNPVIFDGVAFPTACFEILRIILPGVAENQRQCRQYPVMLESG